MKKTLSKSQVNLYLQCPYKWKRCYIDGTPSIPSKHQKRGIEIHEKIENFYKDSKIDKDLKNFKPKEDEDLNNLIKFEYRRIKDMIKAKKLDQKYFYPIFQELKMSSPELGLKGICDAVFINPADDKLIVIDWKTGKYYPDKFDDYRFELAVYSELLKHSGKTDEEPGYWGIYFTDQDKLFFEKIDKKYIDKMYEIVEKARKGMEEEKHKPKKNQWCYFCQFKYSCPLMGYEPEK